MKKLIILTVFLLLANNAFAGTITYNQTVANCDYVYRATGGGVTFSANLATETAFDYFTDTAVADDAIYFAGSSTSRPYADILLNVGTAMAGTDIVLKWEYYHYTDDAWVDIVDLSDDTTSLTVGGANRVKFPFQMQWENLAVNGVTEQWVRCRIDSLTAITEGGANQTTAAKSGDGNIRFVDYTEESPCNLTAVYDYMVANYSYVSIKKIYTFFDFTKVAIFASGAGSWLESHNEVLMIGTNEDKSISSGATNGSRSYFDRFTSGTKVGDDKGKGGSVIIVNGTNNAYPINFGTNTKMYAATVKGGKGNQYGAGYGSPGGEWIDCLLEYRPAMNALVNLTNCKVAASSGFITTQSPSTFDGVSAIINWALFYVYHGSFEFPNLGYGFNSVAGNCIIYFYATAGALELVLLNPKTPLPSQGGDNYIANVPSIVVIDWATVYYYDASEGTYTDYTTEANSTGAADFPIGGDVGDIYYFRQSSSTNRGLILEVESDLGSNNFEYTWYRYRSGWQEYLEDTADNRYQLDYTSNLSASANWYLFVNTIGAALTSTTINGTAGYWRKMEITVKGTGSPTITKLRGYGGRAGISDWTFYEKYTLDLKVVDDTNTAIDGAVVTVHDSTGTLVVNTTTDATGVITQQKLIRKYCYFDPAKALKANVAETTMGDFTLTISYAGKRTYTGDFTLGGQIDWLAIMSKGDTVIYDSTLYDCNLY